MTIVEQQEIMDPSQNLEAELDDGEHDIHEYDGDYDDEEVAEDAGSEDEVAPTGAGNFDVADWVSLEEHPAPTAARILRTLRGVASQGRNSLSILLIGRSGIGKSSTANSIFASSVAQAVPFHIMTLQPAQPVVIRKKAEGVTLTVIDTAAPIESDNVNEQSLKRIAYQASQNPVDVVLFVDRFDMPSSDDLDKQLASAMTRVFGSEIWSRVVIGLTHADVRDPIPDQTYESMIAKRVSSVREMMRQAGSGRARLPFVLIENSERCVRNASREKVLPNGTIWVPALFEAVSQVAQSFPTAYKYNDKTVNRNEQLFAKFILIPLVLIAQIVCKFVILDNLIQDDGLKGDSYGRFEQYQQEHEKKRRAAEHRSKGKQKSSSAPKGRDYSLEDELSDSEAESED